MAGAVLTLGLAASLLGTGAASAQAMTATSTAQLVAESSAPVAAGTELTIKGSSYEADEQVSFWINVPDETTIPSDSLGQTDTTIEGTVIPLNATANTDDYGAFTYTLNTSGLPSGSYSFVAHGLTSQKEEILNFTINGSVAPAPLTVEGSTTVAAGTVLTIYGASYEADELVSLWINVPVGTTIPSDSLGQIDTKVTGTVIPLNDIAGANAYGMFTYTLNTSVLPSGNYSLVAHGHDSGIESVVSFTIH